MSQTAGGESRSAEEEPSEEVSDVREGSPYAPLLSALYPACSLFSDI